MMIIGKNKLCWLSSSSKTNLINISCVLFVFFVIVRRWVGCRSCSGFFSRPYCVREILHCFFLHNKKKQQRSIIHWWSSINQLTCSAMMGHASLPIHRFFLCFSFAQNINKPPRCIISSLKHQVEINMRLGNSCFDFIRVRTRRVALFYLPIVVKCRHMYWISIYYNNYHIEQTSWNKKILICKWGRLQSGQEKWFTEGWHGRVW